MARPLVGDIYEAVRFHAGDTAIPGGQLFTNAFLQVFYQFAYSELFRALLSAQNPAIQQESYYDLPAYTSVLDPATAGITGLGEIESIEERGSVTEVAITGAVPAAALLTVTAVGHPFVTGDQAVQYAIGGLSADADGLFTVTKTGANTYTANGCTATGTYTSGGTAAKSTEQFSAPLTYLDRIREITTTPVSELDEFAWEGDLIYFPPCSALRQLRITYQLSGDAPTDPTATIRIDDAKDFLAARTAGLALSSRGNRIKGQFYNEMAVGPKWGDGIAGGLLDQLLGPGVRALQNLPQSMLRSQARGAGFRSRYW